MATNVAVERAIGAGDERVHLESLRMLQARLYLRPIRLWVRQG
jgi:hypothetical protein